MYSIQPNPYCDKYAPLTGWRWFLSLFRIPVHRSRMVVRMPNGVLVCHPSTVPSLTEYLTAQRHEYRVLPPHLQRVK